MKESFSKEIFLIFKSWELIVTCILMRGHYINDNNLYSDPRF